MQREKLLAEAFQHHSQPYLSGWVNGKPVVKLVTVYALSGETYILSGNQVVKVLWSTYGNYYA